MENISHSIPNRRSFNSYSNAPHNSVYDHAFGGPPKVGIPTLAPRFEDYAEIFGGFHAYRSSSIPVLHLPLLADDSELHLQVRSSDFDYTEVFGGFRGFGSAASYEDLLGQSVGRYDSSDDPWSPVQSESLSDKVDPLLASDKNYRLPDGDGHQSLESIKQFNIYYNKSSERTMESMLNGHVTNLVTTPGYTYLSNDISVPPNEKDELCAMPVTDDINCSKNFSERVAEEKQYDKSLLTPSYSGFATRVYDFNASEKHGYSSFTLDKPFMTISDISLRTKPSQLPPPSRPPPALAAKNGACDRSNSIFGASKSYAFERVLDGTSPYFFDVEVDVTSSAQGVENGNKSFRVKQSGTEKLNEKKDIQAHSKLHLENATKMKEKTNKTFSLSSALRGEKMQQSHRIETIGSVPFIEESLRARNSTEPISESQGGKYPNHFAKNSNGTAAWREAKEYFEVMETKNSKEAFEKVEGGDTLMRSTSLDAYKHQGTVEPEQFHQKQDSMRIKAIKEAPIWDEDRNPLEMTAEDCDDCGNEHGRIKANNRLSNKKELQEKLILNKLTCIYNLNEMIPETFQQPGEKLWMDHGVIVEKHEKALCHEVEAKWKLEAASDQMETVKGFIYAHSRKEENGNHKENIVRPEYQRRPEEAVVQAETRKRVKERIELEENDTQQRKGGEKENVTKLNETHEQKENEMRVKQAVERRDCGKEIFTDVVHAKIMVNEQLHCKLEKDKEAGKQEATEMRFGNCPEHARDDTKQKEFHDCELMKDRSGDSLEREINEVGMLKAETKVGNKGDPFEREIELPLYRDASTQEELRGQSDEIELIQKNGHLKEVNLNLESHVLIEGDRLRVFDEASECYDENSTEVAGKHNDPLKMEETEAILSVEGNEKLNDEHESRVHEPEARMDDPLFNEKINRFGKNKVELQDRNSHCVTNHTSDSPSLLEHLKYLNKGDCGNGNISVMLDKIAPEIVFGHETETMKRISTEDETLGKAGAHFIKKEDIRDSLAFREPVESGNMMEGASAVVSDHNEDALSLSGNSSIRKMEIKEKNKNENLASKDQLLRESLRNETVLENKRMRKIEEEREREREREREKDRMAVDKEALETHTRLYAEARERAAVGRTTAEVRQRAMSEARERLELASNEARLRAERAAVERATAEARQRAIEKSIAEKAAFDTRERVEKPMSDRFSMPSRSADTRQSSLSTDLPHQNTGILIGLRNSYASAHFGAEGESPQRCKARLQRYQRTAERAANALAEKNMRDLLAQREREERNRVAEALDTEVRRWSSGKEGNLRALLSTLQYILGPDSGWQPVPLTEVITSAAVKKAYRRATLCVHPDKLQQRGATIQQKYICEKVFDLLKEAWNKFNSEER